MKNEVYLKPNVVAEPLVCGWYAWTHLIQPATAGHNIVERHQSIMKSFVQAPQVHLATTRNPAMTGGPFISYGPEADHRSNRLIEDCRSRGIVAERLYGEKEISIALQPEKECPDEPGRSPCLKAITI